MKTKFFIGLYFFVLGGVTIILANYMLFQSDPNEAVAIIIDWLMIIGGLISTAIGIHNFTNHGR